MPDPSPHGSTGAARPYVQRVQVGAYYTDGYGLWEVIDTPAIHAAGVAEGRAAGRDEALREVVEWLRSSATSKYPHVRRDSRSVADAIEDRFPRGGTT